MPDSPPMRVAYSPAEFAQLFGKSQTWGYRQIYAGHVTTITQHGRILIPAKEVEKILKSAGIYNGMEKPEKTATPAKALSPEQKTIWKRFLVMRRQPDAFGAVSKKTEHVPKHLQSAAGSHFPGKIAAAWQKKKNFKPPE